MSERQFSTVIMLGTAQTLAWASSYYLPAMLAAPVARDLRIPEFLFFAAFSAALIVAAAIGPQAGKAIDRFGGRPVLILSNLGFAAGLALLSQAQNVTAILVAWIVIGGAMGCGLYEAAFATLVRLQREGARKSITGITLIAGFASTLGWPLTAWLEQQYGWRGACLAWAGLHLVIGLPLNAFLKTAPAAHRDPVNPESHRPLPPHARRQAWILAYVFAVSWFVSTAMAVHLPTLLSVSGVSAMAGVAIAALIGPAQVSGRILEFTFLKNLHPLFTARLASLAHPAGAIILLLIGAPAAAAFAILHGLGNGILTIAIGTLPLVLFGAHGYGYRQGLLMAPSRLVQAAAPFAYGILVSHWGVNALWVSATLCLSATCALLLIKTPTADDAASLPHTHTK